MPKIQQKDILELQVKLVNNQKNKTGPIRKVLTQKVKSKTPSIMVISTILGFIFSGFFHYTARHFTFWVELSIFYSYAFHNYLKNNKPTTT